MNSPEYQMQTNQFTEKFAEFLSGKIQLDHDHATFTNEYIDFFKSNPLSKSELQSERESLHQHLASHVGFGRGLEGKLYLFLNPVYSPKGNDPLFLAKVIYKQGGGANNSSHNRDLTSLFTTEF